MRRCPSVAAAVSALALAVTANVTAQTPTQVKSADPDGGPTRLLRNPTLSASSIAFQYANDIWVAPRAGGDARRITSFQGQETNPAFSPDGRWLDFSADLP